MFAVWRSTKRTGFASPDLLRTILQGRDSETFYRDLPNKKLYEQSPCFTSRVSTLVRKTQDRSTGD